jgi:hypothetical protein
MDIPLVCPITARRIGVRPITMAITIPTGLITIHSGMIMDTMDLTATTDTRTIIIQTVILTNRFITDPAVPSKATVLPHRAMQIRSTVAG